MEKAGEKPLLLFRWFFLTRWGGFRFFGILKLLKFFQPLRSSRFSKAFVLICILLLHIAEAPHDPAFFIDRDDRRDFRSFTEDSGWFEKRPQFLIAFEIRVLDLSETRHAIDQQLAVVVRQPKLMEELADLIRPNAVFFYGGQQTVHDDVLVLQDARVIPDPLDRLVDARGFSELLQIRSVGA